MGIFGLAVHILTTSFCWVKSLSWIQLVLATDGGRWDCSCLSFFLDETQSLLCGRLYGDYFKCTSNGSCNYTKFLFAPERYPVCQWNGSQTSCLWLRCLSSAFYCSLHFWRIGQILWSLSILDMNKGKGIFCGIQYIDVKASCKNPAEPSDSVNMVSESPILNQ